MTKREKLIASVIKRIHPSFLSITEPTTKDNVENDGLSQSLFYSLSRYNDRFSSKVRSISWRCSVCCVDVLTWISCQSTADRPSTVSHLRSPLSESDWGCADRTDCSFSAKQMFCTYPDFDLNELSASVISDESIDERDSRCHYDSREVSERSHLFCVRIYEVMLMNCVAIDHTVRPILFEVHRSRM